MSVSCPFDPLNGRSSLGNMRCLCVLFFSFVNVIFLIVFVSHALTMRHSCNRAFILCKRMRKCNLMKYDKYRVSKKKFCNEKVSSFDVNRKQLWMKHISMSQWSLGFWMPFISANLDVANRRYRDFSTRSQDTNCATFRWIWYNAYDIRW